MRGSGLPTSAFPLCVNSGIRDNHTRGAVADFLREKIKSGSHLTRGARDFAAKAKEIEDSVYDLKAVNPNKKPDVDDRTPEDLIALIESKGLEITAALAALVPHAQ